MGFLSFVSSAVKSIGRGIGSSIEKVGEWTGSTTLQNVGRGIYDACSEVSRETGKTDSYDKERARMEETRRINEMLTQFLLSVEEKADEIEKTAIKESNIYFKELINQLDKSKQDTGININRINRTMVRAERQIKGNLKSYISKRVSIDDSECLEVLKMEAGTEKEKAMDKFSQKILKMGLEELVIDVKAVINEQNDIITEIIEEKLEDVRINLDKEIEEFNILEQNKLKTEEEVNLMRENLLLKIALSEACIGSLT